MGVYITWDTNPDADLMYSISQASMRAAIERVCQVKEPTPEPNKD
jgi:hypothetical protein